MNNAIHNIANTLISEIPILWDEVDASIHIKNAVANKIDGAQTPIRTLVNAQIILDE